MKMKFLITFSLIFFVVQSNGQISFQKTYGTVNEDVGKAVATTFDGGYIMTGTYDDTILGVIKTDNYGNISWIRTFDFPDAITTSIIQTSDSNYVICGSTNLSFLVFKINSFGDTIWKKTYGSGPFPLVAQDITEDIYGNLILAVSTEILTEVCCWPSIYKLDQFGNILWSKYYDCPTNTGCRFDDIFIDFEGNYLVTGGTPYPNEPIARLTKTDTAGNEIFNKYYFDLYVFSNCVTQEPDSGYLISGEYMNKDSVPLIKTDRNGIVESIHSYLNDTRKWNGVSIDITDQGYYISGYTLHWSRDYFLIKLDSNLDMIWSQIYGGNSDDGCNGMVSTSDGGSVMIGYTNSYGAGNKDYFLIKTDQNGLVVGLKDSDLKLKNIKIYPNPAATLITIETPTTPEKNTLLTIYNLSGQQLFERLISEAKTEVDVSVFPQGVYLLRVKNDKAVQIGKLIRQ